MERSLEYHVKWNKSDAKSQEPYDFTDMWDVKLKATNKQTRHQKLIDADNSKVVSSGKEGGRGHGKR